MPYNNWVILNLFLLYPNALVPEKEKTFNIAKIPLAKVTMLRYKHVTYKSWLFKHLGYSI